MKTEIQRPLGITDCHTPNKCHEPQSKVFVLVTQSQFPNQEVADVCEAKIGHMRRLSMDHRPSVRPILAVFS